MLLLAVGEKKIFKWTEVTHVKIHWTLSATDECILSASSCHLVACVSVSVTGFLALDVTWNRQR